MIGCFAFDPSGYGFDIPLGMEGHIWRLVLLGVGGALVLGVDPVQRRRVPWRGIFCAVCFLGFTFFFGSKKWWLSSLCGGLLSGVLLWQRRKPNAQ